MAERMIIDMLGRNPNLIHKSEKQLYRDFSDIYKAAEVAVKALDHAEQRR